MLTCVASHKFIVSFVPEGTEHAHLTLSMYATATNADLRMLYSMYHSVTIISTVLSASLETQWFNYRE